MFYISYSAEVRIEIEGVAKAVTIEMPVSRGISLMVKRKKYTVVNNNCVLRDGDELLIFLSDSRCLLVKATVDYYSPASAVALPICNYESLPVYRGVNILY